MKRIVELADYIAHIFNKYPTAVAVDEYIGPELIKLWFNGLATGFVVGMALSILITIIIGG